LAATDEVTGLVTAVAVTDRGTVLFDKLVATAIFIELIALDFRYLHSPTLARVRKKETKKRYFGFIGVKTPPSRQ
jgi:hypothetical protein